MDCCRSGAGERETGPGYTADWIKAGERPDNSAIIAAREARKRKPERNRQNCSKLTTQQPL